MKKNILVVLLISLTLICCFGGCANGIRITNLPDQWVETNTRKGLKTHTITTKVKGEVIGEIITTDKWNEEDKTVRPFLWEDWGGGYGYGGGRYWR